MTDDERRQLRARQMSEIERLANLLKDREWDADGGDRCSSCWEFGPDERKHHQRCPAFTVDGNVRAYYLEGNNFGDLAWRTSGSKK